MVLFLLRRDGTVKMAFLLALLAPVVLMRPGQLGTGSLLGALAYVGLISSVHLRVGQRASSFEVSLPIAGRQLLLARMFSLLLRIWLPVSVAALLLIRMRGGNQVQPLLQGAAVLTLAPLLPLAIRLRYATTRGWESIALWFAVLATGAATWFLLPAAMHLALFGAIDILLLVRASRCVPDAFEIASREMSENHRAPRQLVFRKPAWWPIFGSALPWIGAGLFLWAYICTPGMLFFIQFSFMPFQAGLAVRKWSSWLYAFPVSHRILLWCTLGTAMVPILAGVAANNWIYDPAIMPRSRGRVGMTLAPKGVNIRDEFQRHTTVPLEFWHHASGTVPTIQAPWGETARPRSTSILGIVLYNPYTATEANSQRFFEWQIQNATQAIYGQRLSWEQLNAIAYDKTPPYRGHTRVAILAFAVLACWLLACVYFRELSFSPALAGSLFARCLPAAFTASMVGSMFLDSLLNMSLYDMPILDPIYQAFLMHLAAILPQNPVAFVAIASAPIVPIYLLVERQFARAEIVPSVTNATLTPR